GERRRARRGRSIAKHLGRARSAWLQPATLVTLSSAVDASPRNNRAKTKRRGASRSSPRDAPFSGSGSSPAPEDTRLLRAARWRGHAGAGAAARARRVRAVARAAGRRVLGLGQADDVVIARMERQLVGAF